MEPRLRILTSMVCERIRKQPEFSRQIGIKEVSVVQRENVEDSCSHQRKEKKL